MNLHLPIFNFLIYIAFVAHYLEEQYEDSGK